MKQDRRALFFCASLLYLSFACAGQLWAASLPDSCGNDKVKFDVKTVEGQPVPSSPADGKAQIVFIENENQLIGPFMHATVRFGVDGSWAGANYGNSYFALTVDPGVHHLCAFWEHKNVDVTSLVTEPGKVYYLAAKVNVQSRYSVTFGLSQLNEDEGEYQVKLLKLSSSKAK
jgi:hypothetical protein